MPGNIPGQFFLKVSACLVFGADLIIPAISMIDHNCSKKSGLSCSKQFEKN
jgi:hypothetical protein